MVSLKVKTRGGSHPHGKQKVYLCCHPQDFEIYLEPIAQEILAKQNCAVWYEDTGAPRDDTFLNELRDMQLFVMPITQRLLFTDNPALQCEFAFAMEHHIPVLPLMQEPGLENAFNNRCGTLQFLDKNVSDSTTDSYDAKLEKYLSSVLITDELAEQVRAAFDAYVFLSYRKKDRAYARELIRLIRQNDFCRDFAIWFDEYLVPGENFNEAIHAALKKSGLFVLTVTPNLVSEENYITTTEYPLALEQGTPILPAEMVSTDRTALESSFAQIPPCTDAHDAKQLSEALLSALQSIAVHKSEHSPIHNFFIGLAYLNGIDVEVDVTLAVRLITEAAQCGLIEAAQKLADMFYHGIGVQRNFDRALQWNQKVVDIARNAYTESPTEDTLCHLFDRLIAYGDYILYSYLISEAYGVRTLGHDDFTGFVRQAKQAYKEAENLLIYGPCDPNRLPLLRRRQIFFERLGKMYEHCFSEDSAHLESAVYQEQQQLSEALAIHYYTIAAQFATYVATDHNTAEHWITLSLIKRRIARLHLCHREHDKTIALYEEILQISEKALAIDDGYETREHLGYVYYNFAHAYYMMERRRAAREYYLKAIDIYEALLPDHGTRTVREMLGYAYYNLALSMPDTRASFFTDRIWFENKKRAAYFEKASAVFKDLLAEYPGVTAYEMRCSGY